MRFFLLCLATIAIPLSTGTWFPPFVKKPQRKKCYTSKAICVPIEFCPKISEALNRHSTKRPPEVKCRECKLHDGQQLSVLCEPHHLTRWNGCQTARNVKGQCIPEEYCHRPVNHVKRSGQRGASREDLCFEEYTKDFYCCPMQSHSKKPIPDGSIVNVYSRCRDSRRRLGRCVPVLQCDRLNRIKTSKTRENFIQKNVCKSDELSDNARSVCCADAVRYSSDHVDWIKHPKAARLGFQNCGSVAMADIIFRGTEAAIGHYPWMANLLYFRYGRYLVKGAGTLIHPRYVLTAAHVVRPYLEKVRLGDYDLNRNMDCVHGVCAQPAKEFNIKRKIMHEAFRKHSDYDIALLELYRDVQLIPQQIYPICLPLTDSLLMLKPRQMTVTGWGWSDRNTSVLLEAELEVTDRDKRLCPGASTFCARGKNWSGHCQGDSGGPYQTVVTIGPLSRYVQFGVISAGGMECTGTKLTPNVGVAVAYHINWILDHMNTTHWKSCT